MRLALDTSISASPTAVFTLPTSNAEAVISAGVASRCVSIGIASRHFLWEVVREVYEDFGVLLALFLSVCRIDASAIEQPPAVLARHTHASRTLTHQTYETA